MGHPGTVTEVIAVEPEPHLRVIAGTYAERTSVPIKIIDGLADHLPADAASRKPSTPPSGHGSAAAVTAAATPPQRSNELVS
jgi:hypothetical protein